MLSLLDSLLGMSMANAIEKMSLPQVVRDVLLKSEGTYGRFLLLALAAERGRVEQVTKLAEQIGIPLESVEDSKAAARVWAEEALKFS